jgi:hypothetical protein
MAPLFLLFLEGALPAMLRTNCTIAAGIAILLLSLGGTAFPQVVEPAKGIPADQFQNLNALIKPKPGGFADVPWMTSLWEARRKAAAEGKPILIWVGDGHPLGFT